MFKFSNKIGSLFRYKNLCFYKPELSFKKFSTVDFLTNNNFNSSSDSNNNISGYYHNYMDKNSYFNNSSLLINADRDFNSDSVNDIVYNVDKYTNSNNEHNVEDITNDGNITGNPGDKKNNKSESSCDEFDDCITETNSKFLI